MATTRKKSELADKGTKKKGAPSKARNKTDVKDEVCIFAGAVMTEHLYLCDDECCCLE